MQAFPPLPSRTSPRILVAPFPFAKETSQQSRLFPPPSRDLERQQKKQLSGTIYHPQRDPLDILRRNASKNPPSLLATRCTAEYVESFAMRRIICRTPRFSDCISPGLIPRAGHFGPGTTVSERWRRPPTRSGGANVVWPSPGKKLGNVIYRGAVRGARVAIQIPRHEAGGTRLTGLATPVQWCFVFCILRKKSCFVWFHLVIPFWKWTKRKIEFIEFMYIKWRWDSCYLDSPFRLSLFSRRDIVRTKLLLFKRLIKRSNKVNRAVVRHL